MIPILLFLFTIAILGIALFVYLHQKQEKVITSKDKYDEAQNEFYKKSKFTSFFATDLSTTRSRVNIFLGAFALVPLCLSFITIVGGMVNGDSFNQTINTGITLILYSPLYLPFFPTTMSKYIMPKSDWGFSFIIGYVAYMVIYFLITFVENRRVLTFIYLAFIMLLIMNMIGCTRAMPEIMKSLSNIN